MQSPSPGRTAREVSGLDWVLRERGAGTRQMFETALCGYGRDPEQLRVALEMPSNEAVRSAVEAGAGATVISHLVAGSGLRAGTLAQLDLAFPERQFLVIRHRDRGRTKVEAALLDMVRTDGH
jgi:Periplasmic molybdate-binding protein/domain